MHMFSELVDRGTHFTLQALNDALAETIDALQTTGATVHVKNLQMISLQKAVLAVGILSLFESMLQDGLQCKDGFREADNILIKQGETVLKDKFVNYRDAINVLKHGKGPSYNNLVAKAALLPFRIKLPHESFFYEGDVSEIFTLIQVDDTFVQSCAAIVEQVSVVIRKERTDFYL